MYSAIEERIDVLAARTEYPCRYLVVMGGVLINSDYDLGSFCCFRRFVCVDLATGRHKGAGWTSSWGSALRLAFRATRNGSGNRNARRMR